MGKFGAIATGNTTVDAAWNLCQRRSDLVEDFLERGAQFSWENRLLARDNPYWAMWFARFVISDRWIPGEDIIYTDEHVQEVYEELLGLYRRLGTLGHTVGEPEPVERSQETERAREAREEREQDYSPRRKEWLNYSEIGQIAKNAEAAVEAARARRRAEKLKPADEDQLGGDEDLFNGADEE